MVAKTLKLHWEYLKISISTALEYRTNFIIQVTSMFVNDGFWILFWYIFFLKFGTIANWNFNDMVLLYGIVTLSFGLSGLFYGNRSKMAQIISQGRLDFYLTLPRNVLYNLLSSRQSFYAIGDVLFGIMLFIFALPIQKLGLAILLTLLSAIIFLAYSIIIGSLSFFVGNSEEMTRTLQFACLGLSSYPMGIYSGLTRILVLTIIPAGFISGVPVELIRTFNLQWFLLMVGFTVLILAVAIALFNYGLRKYESGNLLYVRV